jgi:hypothetical protein
MLRLAFEGLAVPFGVYGCGFVGALAKIEQGRPGIAGGAHVVVGEQELAEFCVEERFCGTRDALAKPCGFWRAVRIKHWARSIASARPPSNALDFVRVGFFCDFVCSGTLGRAFARKTGRGHVETSPEKMHRAGLADESAAKFLEYGIHGYQNPPKAICITGLVTRVSHVLIEANGIRYFDGHRPDFYIEPQGAQHFHELAIKSGDRAMVKRDGASGAAAGSDIEAVVDEVETDFKISAGAGNRGGGEASRGNVERDFPPVVDQGALRQANFSDDLRPHMQGGAGVFPLREGERGPGLFFVGHFVVHHLGHQRR